MIVKNWIKFVVHTKRKSCLELSVIIVNYNVKYFLELCLHSVLKAFKNIEAEIIVVDNASTDNSSNYFQDKFSTVQFIWHPENSGFSKANNIGIARAKGEYVLFLNPDTIVPEDCFDRLIPFLKSAKSCGGVGVKMLDGTGN